MRTVFKTSGIITLAFNLLLGPVTASFAIGDKLGVPEQESIPLVPVGPEFQVNSYTAENQFDSNVAMDDEGNFVVVWQSYAPSSDGQDGDSSGIFAQRYDYMGIPLGGEFQVNTSTTNHQRDPDVAMDSNGNFVIVWVSPDESEDGVFGQRYDHTGTPQGPEFQVNTHTLSFQAHSRVTLSNDGQFTIVWTGGNQDGNGYGIFGQRYDSTGTPTGLEFQINTTFSGDQMFPSIANNDDGYVVVWQGYNPDERVKEIYGQRYDHIGTPEGPEFTVNTTTMEVQTRPEVAMDSQGNFMVTWISNDTIIWGDPAILFGQRYDFTGTPVGPEFQITPDMVAEHPTSVAMDDNGNAWVSWTMHGEVFVQGYDAAGSLIGNQIQVNTFKMSTQRSSDIAIDNNGHAVIAWTSNNQDGDQHGIFAQRFIPNQAPNCAWATPVPSGLYSNDHAFHVINIANVWDPDGDAVTLTVDEIYQDEAVNASGSGGTHPDGQGIGTNAAEVRDEHVIGGNGRRYRIRFTAEDESGSSCSKTVYVQASPQLKTDPDLIIYDSTEWAGIVGE